MQEGEEELETTGWQAARFRVAQHLDPGRFSGRHGHSPMVQAVLAYVLQEDWIFPPPVDMYVDRGGELWASVGKNKPHRNLGPINRVVDLLKEEVCRRFEMDEMDSDWLLSMPRVRRRDV